MRKARHRVQVSTFPFLAVLLCAMGALILVLLTMDQRARKAATARAAQAARDRDEEHDRLAALRREEQEAKKHANSRAWAKKKEMLTRKLDSEQAALDEQMNAARARMAEASRKLKEEEDRASALRERLAKEKAELGKQEVILASVARVAENHAAKLVESDEAKKRLLAELSAMEQSVKVLAAARERDKTTFNVVPYHGKMGTTRKPIYVECAADGLVFHPGAKRVAGDKQVDVRKEVQDRMAAMGMTGKPYLMVLVRPAGVRRWYELQTAMRGMEPEFGMELVEAAWEFDFPESKGGPPSRVAEPAAPKATGPVRLLPPAAKPRSMASLALPQPIAGDEGPSLSGSGGTDLGGTAGIAGGTSGATSPASPPSLFSGEGRGEGVPSTGGESAGGAPQEPTLLRIPGSGRGQGGGQTGSPPASVPAPPAGGKDGIVLPPLVSGKGQGGAGGGGNGSTGEASDGASAARIGPYGKDHSSRGAAQAPPAGGTTGRDGGPKQERPRLPDVPAASLKPSTPPRLPLRAARLSADEVVVHVECFIDHLVVHPGRRRVSLDALSHSDAHNPLLLSVRQGLARKPIGVEAPRLQVRFLVHPDGERVFHSAYPVLERVVAPKTLYKLQPEDDVAAIIAGR